MTWWNSIKVLQSGSYIALVAGFVFTILGAAGGLGSAILAGRASDLLQAKNARLQDGMRIAFSGRKLSNEQISLIKSRLQHERFEIGICHVPTAESLNYATSFIFAMMGDGHVVYDLDDKCGFMAHGPGPDNVHLYWPGAPASRLTDDVVFQALKSANIDVIHRTFVSDEFKYMYVLMIPDRSPPSAADLIEHY